MRIASIENENGVSSLINSHFDKNEVVVEKIESMDELLFKDCSIYDLILVDMTHNRCLQFIQYIKQKMNIPVIYLTERYQKNPYEQELDDKDFVIHSYTREEFIDDIFNKVEELSKSEVIDLGACTLDEANGIFKVGNKILDLTRSELEICSILIHNMAKILSKEDIVEEMGKRNLATTPRSVREHIRKIRVEFKKADLEPIDTITAKGYRWALESLTRK
ncbi:winged helix-turn-helix domain-containing protein [Anaerococcus lactolyticus]|uniref:Transcriptional regulatory protein, C-terminal domain protein n=2 Tax=Anaerococcus lactolyticus TaxID=33032 RepID=C2BG75_9FIRM|nr:winged helix-turn-helix domain-containing protein [Anaerococcus lactolyticus]EEI86002.1 transcriptional regulatory protein, C-terminal domain protein [Anaerococcus lactolyticus ATCC 51172]KGF05272.1 transcriptional regulator [Anaerococcus lactolyticus S7-1-13]